ncbi:MAG: hypothetical protein A49_10240 [Methyloceanibacter sp.]|nr:MAG: hypothetical protein A49_10240 [Methyloceanibacter sp.]
MKADPDRASDLDFGTGRGGEKALDAGPAQRLEHVGIEDRECHHWHGEDYGTKEQDAGSQSE